MISEELAEVVGRWGWKPTGGNPMSPDFKPTYDGTGALKGRASIYRKGGKRGGKGTFVLKLDGKEHELGKKASFDHADRIVRRELRAS